MKKYIMKLGQGPILILIFIFFIDKSTAQTYASGFSATGSNRKISRNLFPVEHKKIPGTASYCSISAKAQ